jgi:hypothetical protein
MDWRNRKYYCASFSLEAVNMRLELIKTIPTVKIHMGREVLNNQTNQQVEAIMII